MGAGYVVRVNHNLINYTSYFEGRYGRIVPDINTLVGIAQGVLLRISQVTAG